MEKKIEIIFKLTDINIFLKISDSSSALFRTDLMCIITLCKVNIFSIGKESSETTLIFAN